jgi:lipopolysaccharide export system protein LptC
MDEPEPTASRPERLTRMAGTREVRPGNPYYTRFVRTLKLVLPLIALALVGMVMAWPKMNTIPPVPSSTPPAQQQVNSNELLHPRFQGEDSKNQHFVVTADRAIQSARDPDVLLLDQPRGHYVLTNGTVLDAEAVKGAFRQHAQRLLLEEKVVLHQNQGYIMRTERLMVDTGTKRSWTDLPVRGDGPAASIVATGLQSDNENGTLIFTGPATLTLKQGMGGLKGL